MTGSRILEEHGKVFNICNRIFMPIYSLDYIKDLKDRKINIDYQQEEFKADVAKFVELVKGEQ